MRYSESRSPQFDYQVYASLLTGLPTITGGIIYGGRKGIDPVSEPECASREDNDKQPGKGNRYVLRLGLPDLCISAGPEAWLKPLVRAEYYSPGNLMGLLRIPWPCNSRERQTGKKPRE